MADLEPSVVNLDKGLNLQTAKLVAPAGSVLDTLNYEQVDFQGQKRIDGFARYDGGLLSAIDEYYVLQGNASHTGTAGDLVATDVGLLGICVATGINQSYVAVINNNALPVANAALYKIVNGVKVANGTLVSIIDGIDSGVSADTHYTNLLAFNAVLRARVEELPGNIIGLHWFRDRLYAVADVTTVSLNGTTPTLYPNDTIVSNGETAKVLDTVVLGNTRIVFLNSMTPANWTTSGQAVTRNSISVGNIANGFEPFTAAQEVASFFESRTEDQVLLEDGPAGPYNYGWRFVDQGWAVPFADGISLYGSLPSLNQNIIGLGIQGPTSITGTNGKPLLLVQKHDITGKPTQVNGWKDSNTPLSYELTASNVGDSDSLYVYADAFISWNGTTGAVSAPGLTSSTLIEYPANNTVVIQ